MKIFRYVAHLVYRNLDVTSTNLFENEVREVSPPLLFVICLPVTLTVAFFRSANSRHPSLLSKKVRISGSRTRTRAWNRLALQVFGLLGWDIRAQSGIFFNSVLQAESERILRSDSFLFVEQYINI